MNINFLVHCEVNWHKENTSLLKSKFHTNKTYLVSIKRSILNDRSREATSVHITATVDATHRQIHRERRILQARNAPGSKDDYIYCYFSKLLMRVIRYVLIFPIIKKHFETLLLV